MTELAKLSVKDWSPEDRPREKLLLKGVKALSNTELLAILLRSGTKEVSVVELSQHILQSVGNNLNQLGKISISQLMSDFKGIGEAKAISIIAALELGKRRQAEDVNNKKKITCSLDIYLYFYPFLCDLPYEEFWALYLNRSNGIIDRLKISQGGISETTVDNRIIYREAILRFASSVVLCHNHPSGNHLPSPQDNSITFRIKKGLEMLDLKLVDHIVFTDKGYYSYADNGKFN